MSVRNFAGNSVLGFLADAFFLQQTACGAFMYCQSKISVSWHLFYCFDTRLLSTGKIIMISRANVIY